MPHRQAAALRRADRIVIRTIPHSWALGFWDDRPVVLSACISLFRNQKSASLSGIRAGAAHRWSAPGLELKEGDCGLVMSPPEWITCSLYQLYRVPEIVTRGRFPDGGESDSTWRTQEARQVGSDTIAPGFWCATGSRFGKEDQRRASGSPAFSTRGYLRWGNAHRGGQDRRCRTSDHPGLGVALQRPRS